MPNREGQRNRKRMPKRGSPTGLNRSSVLSKVNYQELEAEMMFPMPNTEVSVEWKKVIEQTFAGS